MLKTVICTTCILCLLIAPGWKQKSLERQNLAISWWISNKLPLSSSYLTHILNLSFTIQYQLMCRKRLVWSVISKPLFSLMNTISELSGNKTLLSERLWCLSTQLQLYNVFQAELPSLPVLCWLPRTDNRLYIFY